VIVGKPEAIEGTRKLFEEAKKTLEKYLWWGGGKLGITLSNSLKRKILSWYCSKLIRKKAKSLPSLLKTSLSLMGTELISP
jgi:hypothetical protein